MQLASSFNISFSPSIWSESIQLHDFFFLIKKKKSMLAYMNPNNSTKLYA